jgi:hypothetical protein
MAVSSGRAAHAHSAGLLALIFSAIILANPFTSSVPTHPAQQIQADEPNLVSGGLLVTISPASETVR